MGKLLKFVFIVVLFFVPGLMTAYAQTVTPIYDIQYNSANPGGPSPLKDQQVTIQGVVTVGRGAFSASYFFIQDTPGAWNGIQVYLGGSVYRDSTILEGDSLQVTGVVGEYNESTQIASVSNIVRLGTNKWMKPVVITTAELDAEDIYECVLVQVQNVTVVDTTVNPGSFDYAWEVNDGSGKAEIGTRAKNNYYYHPVHNDAINSITGVVMENKKAYVLEPRAAYDFTAINGITMIQSLQQVRLCEDIAGIDTSYFEGDTVVVRGIVTVPSGLFYAGAGITVYLQDKRGGLWSGILAFAATPTGIDQLYEGDEVQVKAIVTEYEHAASGVSMTELRGVEAFTLLSEFNPLPEPILLTAIELDSTNNIHQLAEKYEGILVKLQNTAVDSTVRWSAGIRDFRLKDSSGGRCWAESRSDSLFGYEPPVGTLFKSVTGVVYNRFGNYLVLPRFRKDLILSSGPPIISSVYFLPEVPTPVDKITIRAAVQDESKVMNVILYYRQNQAGFQQLPMSLESGFVYLAEIGPFADQTKVDYYVSATDDSGNVALSPENAPTETYSFTVKAPQLELKTIATVKVDANNDFVPDLMNTYVRVQGIVTGNRFADYYTNAYVQDKTAGINLFIPQPQFFRRLQVGDSVDVVGRINQYNGLTEIQPDDTTKITILGKGKLPEPLVLTCADLGENVGELHECKLIVIKNVTITGGTWPAETKDANITITDNSGSCTLRIDKDTDIDGKPQPQGAINIVGLLSQYDSSTPYSSGYQLLPRSMADISPATSVAEKDVQQPFVFSLAQNFPNPFNPTTTIRYSIANDCLVNLDIYNVMGQKIKTLMHSQEKAGYKTAIWDGTDDSGGAVASGIYIYRIHAADFVSVKKMILIK